MTKPEIDALISKWRYVLDEASVIPSWTEDHCLAYLAELASKSERIVEIGTYLGRSAKVMLLANPNLKLYCIDTFECAGEPWCMNYLERSGHPKAIREQMTTLEICRSYTLDPEVHFGRCVLIKGDSEQGAKILHEACLVLTGQADAIWIDDGHLKTDLERDIRCLLPFLKSGGVMVGHDYDPGSEVEQGVLSMLPADKITTPCPRLWSYTKP